MQLCSNVLSRLHHQHWDSFRIHEEPHIHVNHTAVCRLLVVCAPGAVPAPPQTGVLLQAVWSARPQQATETRPPPAGDLPVQRPPGGEHHFLCSHLLSFPPLSFSPLLFPHSLFPNLLPSPLVSLCLMSPSFSPILSSPQLFFFSSHSSPPISTPLFPNSPKLLCNLIDLNPEATVLHRMREEKNHN